MHFVEIIDGFSERLGIPLLTHEYRIACLLIDRDTITPKDLMRRSGLSSTGFYNTLERMRLNGTVVARPNPQDARSKVYSLDPEIRAAILDQFDFYRKSELDAFNSLDARRQNIRHQKDYGDKTVLTHLTCEYQILLYLFLQPGLVNSEFVDIVNASPTKFNATLARLTASGLLYVVPDIHDRRRKRYFIIDGVRTTLTELHQRVFHWLDSHRERRGGG